MMTWQDRAIELKPDHSWTETARIIQQEYFRNEPINEIYSKVRAHLRRYYARNNANTPGKHTEVLENSDNTPKLISLLKSGLVISDIAHSMGVSERVAKALIEDLTDKGHCIDEKDGEYLLSTIPHQEPEIINRTWNGERIIRFGLLGDTQINSKYTQITHLHTAYDTYKREGIDTVYHTGDIDEGEQMRPGHQYECYTQGADDHVSEIVKVYPKIDGITTHFITGNHDHSLIKRAGYDIGRPIANERPDMKYIGQSSAFVKLTPNCTMELRHPGDGTAYALSYKLQKMIEAMSGGEKPNILAVGHYHKSEYLFYRNVHAVQTGCLQAQTPWMRGKGIAAALGYWIIEVHVDDDGHISRFKSEYCPFYRAIADDWKNWR
jgi:hypothetical protein